MSDDRPKHQRDLANFVRLTRDLSEKNVVWSSGPSQLEYSTTSACNLRCPMCPQADEPPVVNTPKDLQRPFLEEVFRTVSSWVPIALSEPLLVKFDQFEDLLVRENVWLDITTNAMLLTPEKLERILPRLHRVTISFDSHEKEVFERIRPPAVFETVVEHMRHAVVRCAEAQVPVTLHMVLVEDVLEKLEEYVDFVADLGVLRVSVLELLPTSSHFAEMDPFARHDEEYVAQKLEAMKRRAKERGVGLLLNMRPGLGGEYSYSEVPMRLTNARALELMQTELANEFVGFCPMVMTYLEVEPNGRAFPCCRAPQELYPATSSRTASKRSGTDRRRRTCGAACSRATTRSRAWAARCSRRRSGASRNRRGTPGSAAAPRSESTRAPTHQAHDRGARVVDALEGVAPRGATVRSDARGPRTPSRSPRRRPGSRGRAARASHRRRSRARRAPRRAGRRSRPL
ncbi:MAG: radical SAM protein [Planctomycetota bacterium]